MHSIEAFNYLKDEVTQWRRRLHRIPELGYDLYETAAFVAEKLRSFGIDHIEEGVAKTGIVALIEGSDTTGATICLRADMDALPIVEQTKKPWASTKYGKMHGCGHDGHMAMLLGAAKHLATTRNFKGRVALIFQPAEEGGLGGLRMVQDGIMDRYNISSVFGLHNEPGMSVGSYGTCYGPFMAALDEFDLIVKGKGGHAAEPHRCIDPIVIAAHILLGLQSLVSRGTDPLESMVVSVTKLGAGEAYNIIPEHVTVSGTVRTLSSELRDFAQRQIDSTAQGIAAAFGGTTELRYRRQDPVTFNTTAQAEVAIKAARAAGEPTAVNDKLPPVMGSEDFAYMLEARPGCYMFLGNGSTAALHNPAYDFNDDAVPYGIAYWVNLVETVLSN
ncbi:amidohydrolase [Sinorhizobium medicae]|uniref:M20 aminoacylase family protein n=1 Tax=Sinorhizobium medicae TaxID=110321 RepID=UPI001294ACD4|nr:M20 aminoacylase family protein [Sinorhizobium medicae]MDX2388145.1 amidohydrolase [Sinorhizobium medicae]MQU76917.1 amidohydrolase [Sinorhizobium medicae]